MQAFGINLGYLLIQLLVYIIIIAVIWWLIKRLR